MMRLTAMLLIASSMAPSASAQRCEISPLAVQILGSGGPALNADRASASYIVWIDGHGTILVDAGGGAFLRFGQAGARLNDLSLIAISHLHPDHVSDLPALLWSPDNRKEPLAIAGPSGNKVVPDFSTFLSRLFDPKSGAFQVLGGWMGASGRRGVPLEVTVIDATKREPSMVFRRQGLTVTAIGVPHTCCPAPDIPALAYRVQAQNKTIVFGGDQNGSDPRFVEFARSADVLIMHLTIPGPESDAGHASPRVVGQIARDAHIGRLVLGHIGRFDLEPAIRDVRKYYGGPLTVGADLQCIPVR
jgi:ribonuclease BN (tRNA processing enzyme)